MHPYALHNIYIYIYIIIIVVIIIYIIVIIVMIIIIIYIYMCIKSKAKIPLMPAAILSAAARSDVQQQDFKQIYDSVEAEKAAAATISHSLKLPRQNNTTRGQ